MLFRSTDGLPSHRQLTFTEDSNETSPQWARDGSFFVFSSNREGDHNQIYAMRPDGGEARRVTDVAEGVRDFTFSDDGQWLAYRSGKSGQEQLYRLPVAEMHDAEAEQITDEPAGIESWRWAPDSDGIYFTRPDSRDADNEQTGRQLSQHQFTIAQIRHQQQNQRPPVFLLRNATGGKQQGEEEYERQLHDRKHLKHQAAESCHVADVSHLLPAKCDLSCCIHQNEKRRDVTGPHQVMSQLTRQNQRFAAE